MEAEHDTCEFCGNDAGQFWICTDCLAPEPAILARILADELGGEPDDYGYLAHRMAAALA